MSYMHIQNLYRSTDILEFRWCYALEKIHGTSAHITYLEGQLSFFSGGVKHESFVALFDQEALAKAFAELGSPYGVIVYGEAYGGKCQGMSKVYGPDLRFVAFEVRIREHWLTPPKALEIATGLGLEFVDIQQASTDMDCIDVWRDAPSVQAQRNDMGIHPREGIVLRPPFEVTLNNGDRVMAKHKTQAYQERRKQPKVGEQSEVLKQAQAIADEWVTYNRLAHVSDSLMAPDGTPPGIEDTGNIIKAMIADIEREAAGEIEMSKDARRAIGRQAARMFKAGLEAGLEKVWASREQA